MGRHGFLVVSYIGNPKVASVSSSYFKRGGTLSNKMLYETARCEAGYREYPAVRLELLTLIRNSRSQGLLCT